MKLLNNIITKTIILTILPIIYSIALPHALTLDNAPILKERLVILSIITILLHIIAIIIYGRIEMNQKNQIENTGKERNEQKSVKKMLQIVNKVVRDNANMFHELVYQKKGHSDIQDWHLMENKGDEICTAIYQMVAETAEDGKDFSVSMMFKKVENGVNGYTMLSRISNENGHNPRSYRNFVSEIEAEGFYYKKIFDESPTRPQILANKREISKNFQDSTALNYSQYIALPITCKNNKIVGILQIVSYNDCKIAKDKKELARLSNEYFSVYATLMLLCDKYENVQQILHEG